MRSILLTCILLLPVICFAQNLKYARKKSHETLIYRIPADTTAKYLKKDDIPIDAYLNRTPDRVVLSDSFEVSELPNGHHLLITINDHKIEAEIAVNSNLLVYVVNNQKYIQLFARDKWGNQIESPTAFLNGKPIKYLSSSHTFSIHRKVKEDDIIKVCSQTDTVFLNLDVDEEADRSMFVQRWKNFKFSKMGKVVMFIPNKILGIFDERYRYRKPLNAGKGFMVFNQPKYKLGDTVKVKAYILNSKNKIRRKSAEAWMEYYDRGGSKRQSLGMISPSSPGSFLKEIVLIDTLPNDATYTVVFRNKKGKRLVQGAFKTEDYVLDEVATYTVTSAKTKYLASDSIIIIANAKDANGLNLLDGKAKLHLLPNAVNDWKKDSVQVPDTLFVEEKKLESVGDTRFAIDASFFPKATMKINAIVEFRNSNNEIQNRNVMFDFVPGSTEIVVTQQKDTIVAEYFVEGKAVVAKGTIEIEGDKLELKKSISYPVRMKIDPLADAYSFKVDGDTNVFGELDINGDDELVTASLLSNGDTLGFTLHNPYKLNIHYSVMNGDHVMAMGTAETAEIIWKKTQRNERRAYRVEWQYRWAGEEQTGSLNFGYLYKNLAVDVYAQQLIFPGQKDTITVSVKNFRGKPVANVNLTAASYNNQFKNEKLSPRLPNLAKYRMRNGFERDTYEDDEAFFYTTFELGYHPEWRKKFSVDTMLYYKALFPDSVYYHPTTISQEYYPQVSVHFVQKGVPQEVFMLYLNRQLVYFSGVTDQKNYSFFTPGGYLQIGARLKDRFVEIDSIYIQPNYKHDLFIDLNQLPASSKVNILSDVYTQDETRALQQNLIRYRNANTSSSAYVWQGNEAIRISSNAEHIIGPFHHYDSLHYYLPGQFDITFNFESGYQYQVFPKVVRLEKMPVFEAYQLPLRLRSTNKFKWTIGDTVLLPPVINYNKPGQTMNLDMSKSYKHSYSGIYGGKGKLVIRPATEAFLKYLILYPKSDSIAPIVLYAYTRQVFGLAPGEYTIAMVKEDKAAMEIPVMIKPDQGTYLKIPKWQFDSTDIVTKVYEWQDAQRQEIPVKYDKTAPPNYVLPSDYQSGFSVITGRVVDMRGGMPVPAAAVMLKGSTFGVATDNNGIFVIKGLKKGEYFLQVSAIGYATTEVLANLEDSIKFITVAMPIASMQLNEVVVTAYGVQRKTSFTGSEVSVKSKALEGRVAGLMVTDSFRNYFNSYRGNIVLRGFSSFKSSADPLYVIDGIPYESLPVNISPNDIAEAEIINDASATSLYGSRAAGGAIIISTRSKTMRTQFRDHAFWKPQLFTNDKGEVKFEVTYPDNVTSWQTVVTGIDKKNRSGIGTILTKAYKPVMAQLNLPQFAIDGDSLSIVAKTLNYTKDKFQVSSTLRLQGDAVKQWNFDLPPSESVVKQQIIAANNDILNFQFAINTSTGFKDGEERKISVLQKGTEESTGSFYIVQGDTSINFTAQRNSKTRFYIQNNTLDVLLNELDNLSKYPYYCMEQMASKLKGYLMEQKIKASLKQPFENAKDMRRLLEKLQKGQHYDGGWSWWEQGKTDIYITNYILQSLQQMKDDPSVSFSLRNGYLYLQNQLPGLKGGQLLYTLTTLTEAGHLIDYNPFLAKIKFDSLDQHQQWMFVRIKQILKQDYKDELRSLVDKRIETMTGGVHWGRETFAWYDNHIATTVLALKVLENEPMYKKYAPMIAQYFLESKTNGYWRNTVESASIISAILPQVLETNKQFNDPAVISVNGDSSFMVKQFPYSCTFSSNVKALSINKQGGGFTFFTLYQNWWNSDPAPVNDRFVLHSYFETNSTTVAKLKAGERTKMKVNVSALKEAEYVMIEIPIPAGCIIVNKRTGGYTQYFKDKVVIFRELLTKGDHEFAIDLECRYAGSYTINPAKASLMYFPTLFGRNEMKKVEIR